MECKKCGSHMKVTISRHSKTDNETYRKLKCPGCGNTFYTCECEVDYESIEKEWKAVDRAKAKKGH